MGTVAGGRLPVLAITLGDPAGVGPEVALAALVGPRRLRCRAVLIGDPEIVEDRARLVGLSPTIEVCEAEDLIGGQVPSARALTVVPPPGAPLRAEHRRPGKPSCAGARHAYASIRTAVELARSRTIDALCTAPVNKEWFARAGVARTGHTEILGELSGASDVRMMMAVGDLRVVLATIHVPFGEIIRRLSVEGITQTIESAAEYLQRWWKIQRPHIAVAGLNPHAGDGGVYGDEEARLVVPALRRARRRGIDVSGPHPPDTLFSALGPRADAYVALYHDQGLIPIKQRDVHRAVNITLGLPFVRTSPDHGTAYALAGTGRARPESMREALALALRLAPVHDGGSQAGTRTDRPRVERGARGAKKRKN